MSKNEKVLVGKFGAPVGLIGEIKVNIMTSSFTVFKELKNYSNFDESIFWKFKKINLKGNKCIAHVDNCFSREDATNLIGQKIYSSKKYFPPTKEGEYYIEDLIGCKLIIEQTNNSGEVIDVNNFGAGNLLEVKIDNKKILIPFNKENIISVALNKKEIIANPIKGILDL